MALPQDGGGPFATTHWSVVLAAGRTGTPECAAALEALCRTYWFPLYGYVRRRGYSRDDAEDLTQAFFARLLERHGFESVGPAKGKFRSFLLASINHFLADEWDRAQAQKRGAGRLAISLDQTDAEERLKFEPAVEDNPERGFERRWATTVL